MFSLLSSLPRALVSLPSLLTKSSVNRITPALALSTSTLLRDSDKLVAPHKFPQKFYQEKDPFDGRQEMAKDGYGVELYGKNDGKRKNLSAVVMRFKRLDWGQWIRPRSGRDKKRWKKSRSELILYEKHSFCKAYHVRRFDRAVTSDIKEQRHIPDDPYKIYNNMSWQNYHSVKMKNMELIKKYGATNFNFVPYRAHYMHKVSPHDKMKNKNALYEPPNYQHDIASGIYKPDMDRPQDIPAPFYNLERRHHAKVEITRERKYLRYLRQGEFWYGRISPCSPLRLPVHGTFLG